MQAIGKEVLVVGYLMKPSREEDFAKVSPLNNVCVVKIVKLNSTKGWSLGICNLYFVLTSGVPFILVLCTNSTSVILHFIGVCEQFIGQFTYCIWNM